MANESVSITTPVGRIVQGSLYKPNTTNAEGQPLLIKNGPNAGQPRSDYFFALAIPKGSETHWAHASYINSRGETIPWGKIIYETGAKAFPQAYQSPEFSWKVIDGDSTAPGKLFNGKPGKAPATNEGFPGNWVLKLSGGFAPKIYRAENGGHVQVLEEGYIKTGYFVQVALTVSGNGSQSSPGVYLNHQMVAFSAYGPEINFGPDVASAGFGVAQLPAGASAAPLVSAVALPSAIGVPSAPSPGPIVPPIPVTPNPQFLQVPVPNPTLPQASAIPAVPQNVIVPPIPTSPVTTISPFSMTAKANGATREQMLGVGWTDAQLIAQGYMNA